MEQLRRNAYAKINLGLDVLRRREDGYQSCFQQFCQQMTYTQSGQERNHMKLNKNKLARLEGVLQEMVNTGFVAGGNCPSLPVSKRLSELQQRSFLPDRQDRKSCSANAGL